MELNDFKLAVDASSDHIIITDPKGVIIYANKAVTRVTGYSPREVIGKKPGEIWGGHMPKEFYKKMWNCIRDQRRVFTGEIQNHRKNGEEYTAEVRIAPVIDARGRIRSYIGIERDVTREREIDRSKSEFISVASHQLRTPLTAIKWFAELLVKENEATQTTAQKEYIREVQTSVERMARLIDDLLNVSRIETGRKFAIIPQQSDISEIVLTVVKEQKAMIRDRHIIIQTDNRFKKPIIAMIDAEKMRQVFQNIINNAVKYSKDRGVIRVTCKEQKDKIEFDIEDKGIGIPADVQHRVFGKFFRADNALITQTDGTGLGLFIVKAIVEGHGGKVWFTSKENVGTTFSFSLPLKARLQKARKTT